MKRGGILREELSAATDKHPERMNLPPTPEAGWFPVDLRCIEPGQVAPCDLYRKTGQRDFVLFSQKNLAVDRQLRDRLLANGLFYLYIQDGNSQVYFDFLKNTLTDVVRDPNISSQKKAQAVHASCQEILRWAFDEPRAPFVRKAQEAILPTVSLIMTDDSATKHLIRLTAYDHSTYTHCTNVGIFGVALAKIFFGEGSMKQMETLGPGFFLHDLGKCRIPIEILNKPGALTAAERVVVNRHPDDGRVMLEESGLLTDEARIITAQHHERDDGSGYPLGITGNDIHPFARICRLADVYEALTANRPYHQRKSTFEAFKIMYQQFTSDLDRKLFEIFIQLFSA